MAEEAPSSSESSIAFINQKGGSGQAIFLGGADSSSAGRSVPTTDLPSTVETGTEAIEPERRCWRRPGSGPGHGGFPRHASPLQKEGVGWRVVLDGSHRQDLRQRATLSQGPDRLTIPIGRT